MRGFVRKVEIISDFETPALENFWRKYAAMYKIRLSTARLAGIVGVEFAPNLRFQRAARKGTS